MALSKKASAFTSDCTIPSPFLGFKTFGNQVAGHLEFDDKPCFLTDEKGHVLKMVDMSQPTGVAETSFFEKVFNQKQKNKDLENLKKFLPQYFGLLQITVNGEKLCYLQLENLLAGFAKPSIMDIKIGRCTSDPFADTLKIGRQAVKYKYQLQLGFRVLGFKSYRLLTGKTEFFDKIACKNLTPEDILPNFAYFLNLRNVPDRIHLIDQIIWNLEKLLEWFSRQKSVNFYSSSILIAFDGERTKYPASFRKNSKKDAIKPVVNQRDDVVVRMIDFPHTYFDMDNDSLDANYMFGLQNLIKVFQELKEEFSNGAIIS